MTNKSMSPAIYFPTGTFINHGTLYVIYDLKRLSGLHVGKDRYVTGLRHEVNL